MNTHLEAAGINLLFGGSGVHPTTAVGDQPKNIQILRNLFTKSPKWNPASSSYAGTLYAAKNHLEFKIANDVLVEGNIFDDAWYMGQQYHDLVFTVRGEGSMPWAVVRDITVRNNTFKKLVNFVNIHGFDAAAPTAYATSAVGPGTLTCSSATSCTTTEPHGMTVGAPFGTYAIERTDGAFARADRWTAIVATVTSSTAFTLHPCSGCPINPLPNGNTWRRWTDQNRSINLKVTNNLIHDAWRPDTQSGADLRMLQLIRSPNDVEFSHNTMVTDQNLSASGPNGLNPTGITLDEGLAPGPATGFVFRNNIIPFGQQATTLPIATHLANPVLTNNLWWGTKASGASLPTGNFFEASTSAIGFTNPGADDYVLNAAGATCDYRAKGNVPGDGRD